MMKSLTNYFLGAKRELAHVKWPTRHQLFQITAIVLVFTACLALFMGVVDFSLTKAFQLIAR